MDRAAWLALLRQHRAIAILRAEDLTTGLAMAQAAVAGGFRLLEVTWTSDRPAALIDGLRQALPSDCWVGVGTVLTRADTETAIAAGAQFCFMPHTEPQLLDLCQRYEIPSIPGALTPTEILGAWSGGASSVKVFPCQAVGGPAYIRHLQGPLGHIPLIPTGGVTVAEGQAFLAAGAIAIGIASNLYPAELLAQGDWAGIAARSRAFLSSLRSCPLEAQPPSPGGRGRT